MKPSQIYGSNKELILVRLRQLGYKVVGFRTPQAEEEYLTSPTRTNEIQAFLQEIIEHRIPKLSVRQAKYTSRFEWPRLIVEKKVKVTFEYGAALRFLPSSWYALDWSAGYPPGGGGGNPQ